MFCPLFSILTEEVSLRRWDGPGARRMTEGGPGQCRQVEGPMVPLTQLGTCPAVWSKGTRLKHFTGDPLLMHYIIKHRAAHK